MLSERCPWCDVLEPEGETGHAEQIGIFEEVHGGAAGFCCECYSRIFVGESWYDGGSTFGQEGDADANLGVDGEVIVDEPFWPDAEVDGEVVAVVVNEVSFIGAGEAVACPAIGGEADGGVEIDIGGDDEGDEAAHADIPVGDGGIEIASATVFGVDLCGEDIEAKDGLEAKVAVDMVDDGKPPTIAIVAADGRIDADAEPARHVFGIGTGRKARQEDGKEGQGQEKFLHDGLREW